VQVVAAKQRDTGKTVALKVIFLADPRLEPEHVKILKGEFRLVGTLNHPNIVKIDCVMEDKLRKQVVIAEEICFGDNLLEELQGADTNDERLLVVIFKQVFQALDYMHCHDIIHRDIKPENIIFRHPRSGWAEEGAMPILIDFGLAVEYRPSKPLRGLLGSPGASITCIESCVKNIKFGSLLCAADDCGG
jgi:serine/threonine protein kinase